MEHIIGITLIIFTVSVVTLIVAPWRARRNHAKLSRPAHNNRRHPTD